MLRPIHDQKSRRDGSLSPELVRALRWWCEILRKGLSERKPWETRRHSPVHLFCDARGFPAHLGAVVLVDSECYFTELEPPSGVVDLFRHRRDNQIMGLELLSISLGLCTFEALIRDRNVIVYSDNTGSEVCSVGARVVSFVTRTVHRLQ